jgi:S1-C subfamily serine protease
MVFGLAGGRIHGLDLRKLNAELGEYFSTDHGVLVLDADQDSTLGLRAGDVILAIGDREVEDVSDVLRILRSYEEEESVSFTVMRQGREQRVEGTVG